MKIDESLNNLLNSIEESSIYQKYLYILKQVEKSKDINRTVKNIKDIQKEIVKCETSGNGDLNNLNDKLQQDKKYLYGIPLYQDYIDASNELNDLILMVNKRLQSYIDGLDI